MFSASGCWCSSTHGKHTTTTGIYEALCFVRTDETLSLSNVVLMCAQPTFCATAVSWLGEIITGKRPC